MEYLKKDIAEIMKNTKTIIKYKDEFGTKYSTKYNWYKDKNKLGLINN